MINKLYLCLSLTILLSSCSKSLIQIFDTQSTNTQILDGFYVFETDMVKITYSFWTSNGIMSFSVYNKLGVPIYVDWKNSSFIYNDNKLDYWIDESQTQSLSYYRGYYYNGPLLKPGYSYNEGLQSSNSSTLKPERLTFIPPKSNYYRSQFYLWPGEHYKLKAITKFSVVPRNDNQNKKTKVYTEEFSRSNSPLRFRNYLTFSFTESSPQYFFVDNEFFLNSVKQMDYRHFRGKVIGLDENGFQEYEKPFKRKTSFYIKFQGRD